MESFKTLKCELWLNRDLEEIWNFHCDPKNLVSISPDFLKLSLNGLPEALGKGATFQIVTENKFFKPFLKWDVEYVDWGEEENSKFFIDIQKEGPFHLWKHKHEFRRGTSELILGEKSFHPKNCGTWICDTLEYALKPQFRKFEWVAEKMVTQLFVFRKRRLCNIFKEPIANEN
jgi:ligand-binding SRPBCC domain-containing protein